MLKLIVTLDEEYDEETSRFSPSRVYALELEHSLVSLSKWESIHERPFLGGEKTNEETLSYVACMQLSEEVPLEVYAKLTPDHAKQINDYINAKMTATWFKEPPGQSKASPIITSERIYFWMISLGIPLACETWHLTRLLTLVRVCNEENKPKKKQSPRQIAQQRRSLNEQRLAAHRNRG